MRTRSLSASLSCAVLTALVSVVALPARDAAAGPLLDKALAYSANWQDRHGPAFGCRVEVVWSDASQTTPIRYEDIGDATSWTGPYVAAEALRWHLTGDRDAKQNAFRGLECLLASESTTGKPGFIGRAVVPFEGPWAAYVGNTCTEANNCHLITDGPYAGSYWLGNTSSDTYIGWFYGMLYAWDFLVDEPADQPMRDQIQGAVDRTMTTLVNDNYTIVLPNGVPSDTAADIVGNERIAFHEVAARVVGGHWADEMQSVYQRELLSYFFSAWAPFNRYFQYFAYNLGHTLQDMILHTDTVNLSFDQLVTGQQLYRWVAGTQQSFFDFVAWGGGAAPYTQADVDADKTVLAAVPEPPRLEIQPEQGAYTPDPAVDLLNFLGPIIAQLLGQSWDTIGPMSTTPFPAGQRCTVGFMWDNNPANVCQSADDPTWEYSGDDYLIAYWLGRYHGLLSDAD